MPPSSGSGKFGGMCFSSALCLWWGDMEHRGARGLKWRAIKSLCRLLLKPSSHRELQEGTTWFRLQDQAWKCWPSSNTFRPSIWNMNAWITFSYYVSTLMWFPGRLSVGFGSFFVGQYCLTNNPSALSTALSNGISPRFSFLVVLFAFHPLRREHTIGYQSPESMDPGIQGRRGWSPHKPSTLWWSEALLSKPQILLSVLFSRLDSSITTLSFLVILAITSEGKLKCKWLKTNRDNSSSHNVLDLCVQHYAISIF